jgi:hypothetical protein
VCDYTEGGVLVAGAGVNGIVINAPATSQIFLSGLDIFGAGSAQNGVRLIAGAGVVIENSRIHGFNAANGLGISFQPNERSTLTLNNVTVDRNGSGSTGGGILVQPTGASGSARITLNNVQLADNSGNQLRIDTTGNTFTAAGVSATINNNTITGGGTQATTANGILINVPAGTTTAVVQVNGTVISNNTGAGISASGVSATVRVANSTITGNSTGMSAAGGAAILSAGNNQLVGNPAVGAPNNGAFTGTSPNS